MQRKLKIYKSSDILDPLKGKNLFLRPLEPSDLEILYAWENDHENWKVSQTLTPFSRSILQKYLDDSHLDLFQIRQLRLVIQLNKGNKPLGLIDIFDFDPFHQRAAIGILIGEKSDRQKGYAAESLKVLLEYCFSVLVLNQVYCNILESNERSHNLFMNAGFTQNGIKRSWIRTSKGWEDEIFYQLLRQEWLSR